MASIPPQIKFETSPADSLLSEPSGVFPSLFSASTSSIASSGAATPVDSGLYGDVVNGQTQVVDLDRLDDLYAAQLKSEELGTASPEKDASTEKKTGKKRKSWGQVLPEPKTNLPPRKRAKTEDEKEQRRVERVLRNRRAAQSSRERKRLEVDALERRNRELEALLAKAQSDNLVLYTQLCHFQGKPAGLPATDAAAAPVTLSRELFSSQNGPPTGLSTTHFLTPSPSPSLAATIDPLSLSPAMRPVSDANAGALDTTTQPLATSSLPSLPSTPSASQAPARPAADGADGVSAAAQPGPSPDMTQRPAATLCSDLQCLSAEGTPVRCDFVAVPFLGGVFDVAADGDGHFAESGYLDGAHAAADGQQPSEYSSFLVDGDEALPPLFAAVAGSNDFDIGDYFNADGLAAAASTNGNDATRGTLRRGAGECGSDRPCMPEDVLTGADLQPHTGASLVGCDDAGSAVCV